MINNFSEEKCPRNSSWSWSNKSKYRLSKRLFQIFKTRLASWWVCKWIITDSDQLRKNLGRNKIRLKEIAVLNLHLPQRYRKWSTNNQNGHKNHQIQNTLTHVTCKLRRRSGISALRNTNKMQLGTWVWEMLSPQLLRKRQKEACLRGFLYRRKECRLFLPKEMMRKQFKLRINKVKSHQLR